MSGICGIVTFDGTPVDLAEVQRMALAAPHRGPIVQRWHGAGAVLARQHRSASPSPQPQGDADHLVVAHSRIDNRAELARSLEAAGCLRAGTAPDDATLIATAYDRWGPSCASRIVGDFAFVVWDPRRRQLVAARDPMAMRPLYLRIDRGRRVAFATEVKQLLAVPTVHGDVDEAAAAAYLLARFDPRPGGTFWTGLEKVEPGHVLTCDRTSRRSRRYWEVDPARRVLHRHEHDYAEHLRQVFTEAVAARLRPADTTGILLSGGMDSGSAASVAGALLEEGHARQKSLRAYSWAFNVLRACDERHISRGIVDRYGIAQVDVPADDAGPLAGYPAFDVDLDDPVVGAFQPLIERSLALAQRDDVDIMLGGDRGDLVLGDVGISYLRLAQARRWQALRNEVLEHHRSLGDPVAAMVRRHLLAAVAGRLRRRSPTQWLAWGGRRLRGLPSQPRDSTSTPAWIRPDLLRRTGALEVGTDARPPPGLGAARDERYRWIFAPLHMHGMTWSERTYARYGIGFADPFSDRRLVELVLALPQAVVNRPGDQSKPLLRSAMTGVMPESARAAADKILPTPLYYDGLRHAEATVRYLLTGSSAARRGWVDADELLRHYLASLHGAPLADEFWYALSIERWLRTMPG